MAIQRSALLIADIGGYTRFMNAHRMSLAHAQETVAALLEAVIDAASPLKLAKLEGDAAFLYAPLKSDQTIHKVGDTISNIRQAFLKKQQQITANRLCTCQGCVGAEGLSLKFVTHVGEVAFQKVKRLTELAGVDVILVHRMLKNDVPVREYVLMTDGVRDGLEPKLAGLAQPLAHDFEGIGPTPTHFIDLSKVTPDIAQTERSGFPERLLSLMVLNAKAFPSFLGLRKVCEGFRNIVRE